MSAIAFDLAGLTIAFESVSDSWVETLQPRYGAFRTDAEARFRVRLEARGDENAASILAPRLLYEASEIRLVNDRLDIRSPSVEAEIDLVRGAGWLAAPLHRHGVDLLLRALLAATQPGALLLHGTLLVDGERAFACVGPSGAGKSTLAKLLGERARCDELLLVRRSEDGWQARALPFWHGHPGGGRLAGVHLLRHGTAHCLRSLDRAKTLRRLAPEIVWPNFSTELSGRALTLCEQLIGEVPVAELSFLPQADVWPVLCGVAA